MATSRRRTAVAWTLAFAAVLSVAVALRAALLARPAEVALDRLEDDAFISLSVAASLARGDGLRSSRTPTSGIQPLYVLLAAPLAAGGRAPSPEALDGAVRRALALLHAFDLAAGAMLALFCWRAWGRVGAVVAAAAWALHPAVLVWSSNGLETVVALFMLVAVAWAVEFRLLADGARPRAAYLTGALVGAAVLARVDLAALGAVAALLVLWRARRGGPSAPREAGAALARLGAGFAAVYAPWLAFLASETGDLVPVSGAASSYLGLQAAVEYGPGYELWMLARGARLVAFRAPLLLALAVAAAVGAAAALARARADERAREAAASLARLRVFALFGLIVFLAYVFLHGVWWYLERYLAPLVVLEVALLAAAAATLARLAPARALVAPAAVALTAAAALASPAFGELYSASHAHRSYRRAALLLADRVPAGAVVGAWESGALAYYAPHLDVVNLDGVVDRRAFEAIGRLELDRYVRERGAAAVVAPVVGRNFVHWHSRTGFELRQFLEDAGPVEGPRPGGRTWHVWRVRDP